MGVVSTPEARIPSPRRPTAPKYIMTSANEMEPIGARPKSGSSEEGFNFMGSFASL